MKLSDFFKKRTRLREDIDLSEYFDPYYHSGDAYIVSEHCVQKRVAIPGGPQGYVSIEIPRYIKTKEKLFNFLIKKHDFRKRSYKDELISD